MKLKNILTIFSITIFSYTLFTACGASKTATVKKNINKVKVEQQKKPKKIKVSPLNTPHTVSIKEPITGKILYTEKVNSLELMPSKADIYLYEDIVKLNPKFMEKAKKYIENEMPLMEGINFLKARKDAILYPVVKKSLKDKILIECKRGYGDICHYLATFYPEEKSFVDKLLKEKELERYFTECMEENDTMSCYRYIVNKGSKKQQIKKKIIKDMNKIAKDLTGLDNLFSTSNTKLYILSSNDITLGQNGKLYIYLKAENENQANYFYKNIEKCTVNGNSVYAYKDPESEKSRLSYKNLLIVNTSISNNETIDITCPNNYQKRITIMGVL